MKTISNLPNTALLCHYKGTKLRAEEVQCQVVVINKYKQQNVNLKDMIHSEV